MSARQLAAEIADALTPYVSAPDITSADAALEAAKAAATMIDHGTTPAEAIRSALLHRREHFALQVCDLEMVVADAARVASRWAARRAA